MHAPSPNFVVVGGGQAARWIVLSLRQQGYRGPIVWFSEESHRPYERPPLSKAVLLGNAEPDSLAMFSDQAFAALDVDWRAGQRVVRIDRSAQCVHTEDGSHVGYARLFLATGGRARMLPGVAAHPRIHALRTLDDALRIREQLGRTRHLLVLGGGWIGLEVAASARRRGCRVTLLEAAPRLCQRSVAPVVSDYLRELHQGHGVELRLGCKVVAVHAGEKAVELELDAGARLRGDMLLLGIGLQPNSELAAAAGLRTDNGILVDSDCRSSDPLIFAAGDVANALRADGRRARLESWDNAQRMGIAAACAALEAGAAHADTGPAWFWSDQYDENLQVLGSADEASRTIVRDNAHKRQRIIYFCNAHRVEGVAAINGGREIKVARKWMTQGSFPRLDDLQDPALDVARLPCTATQ